MNHDELPLPIDLYAFGRWLTYAAILVLIGATVFAALVPRWRGTGDDERALAARALARVWRVALIAAIVLVGADLLRLYGQVRSFLDPLEPTSWDVASPILFQSAWGRGWLIQFAMALISVPLARFAPRRPALGVGLLSGASLVVAAASPLTGHAVEHPWGVTLGVGLHALHLVGGGVWLGTLFSLVVAGVWQAGDAEMADIARLVNVFSPVALVGAGAAVGAGVLLAYAYVGNLQDLWGTTYGRTLLVKVGLLGLTLGLGAWNWRRLKPRLGTPDATDTLRRSATVELLIGSLLLVATAVLVALPAPRI